MAPVAPAVASIDRTPLGEPGDGDAALLVEDPPGESPSEASDSDAPRDADDPASEAHAAPEPDILERDEPSPCVRIDVASSLRRDPPKTGA